MNEREGVEPEAVEDVSVFPAYDINLSGDDRYELRQAISRLFATEPQISNFLARINYPVRMIPSMDNRESDEIWANIFRDLDNGVIAEPYSRVLGAALRVYGFNPTLQDIAARYGLIEAEPSEGSPVVTADRSSAAAYHVIFRTATEEDRVRARELLESLNLKPREVWTTADAVSFELESERREDPHLLLERSGADLGWVVVPPSSADYLLRQLLVEGPDGRQFRFVDTPAATTVEAIAAELIDQYPVEGARSSLSTSIDRVDASGQPERLNPEQTLDDAGVRDGDRLRVSSTARAGGGSGVSWKTGSPVEGSDLALRKLMLEQQQVRLEREQVRLERERLRLRRENLKVKQEELILQEISRRVSKTDHVARSSRVNIAPAEETPPADSMQVAIYADIEENTKEWRRLSSASQAVAEALGYVRESQLPTEYGSVFQRAFWKRVATSEEAKQYEAMLQQALGLKVAMLNQAEVDQKQAAAAADLITALAAVPTACIKVGSLLLIKYAAAPHDDPVVLVRSLSSREVQAIDRYPAILKNPHSALDALSMAITAGEPSETAANERSPE
jgi:Effector-associated domain 1